MVNAPGAQGIEPSVISEVVTNSRGTSVPGGVRTAVIVGEGQRVERLVSSAVGSGRDGLDPTYSTTSGSDGRHFLLSFPSLVSNRTVLFKNGVPLTGLEEAIDDSSFSSRYDYRIDISTGEIELQGAALVDLGGDFYSANSLNVGNGTIKQLTLLDDNAPTETWTIRCISVRRDTNGDPVDGYAKFVAQGSVSGNLLDGYGNVVVWQSDNTLTDNGILSFSIDDGSVVFREGDRFTVKVKGGALTKGDSLVARYIATTDLNDPEFFTDITDLTVKHGAASTTNLLSLGAQLAFANSPPGVWACQAAPAIPRRISYVLEASASGNSALDDLRFRLPFGVVPDSDSNIHFFVTDPVTQTETQIVPNKVAFYNSSYGTSPASFTTSPSFEYSYTVISDPNYDTIAEVDDGVVTVVSGSTGTVSSDSYLFTSADASANRKVRILTPNVNAGDYSIVSVSDGVALLSGSFTASTSVEFQVLDNTSDGAVVLFTDDLALTAGQQLRATIVDVKDATFFDVGWESAYEALELIETDIVVPLPSQTISSIFTAGAQHCQTMSSIRNKKERVLFIGAIQGLTPDNVIGNESAAVEDIGILEGIQGDSVTEILAGDTEDLADYGVQSAYGSTFRVVYFYPDEIVVQVGSERVKMSGYFAAAAAAGYLCAVPNIAIPLTNKTLAGFTILRDKLYRPSIRENIINAGITLLQPVTGGAKVIWGRTTTASGFPEEEEISVVFIRDRIAKTMRAAFAGYIGQAESATLIGSLMARANAILASFISGGLITAFTDVKVVRDSVDPRQYNISAQVQPIYGVNWIYIRVGLGIL